MLAPEPARLRLRPTPVWVGMDSPLWISIEGKATVRLAWQVTRIDSGRTISAREIATTAESGGGSAPEHKPGVERIALMTNIASIARCIDRSALGRPPPDCAPTPGFDFRAPSLPTIFFMRR